VPSEAFAGAGAHAQATTAPGPDASGEGDRGNRPGVRIGNPNRVGFEDREQRRF
jgi:hypothetical protein